MADELYEEESPLLRQMKDILQRDPKELEEERTYQNPEASPAGGTGAGGGLPVTPQPPLPVSETLREVRAQREAIPEETPTKVPINFRKVTPAPLQDTGSLPKGFAPADKKEWQNKVEQTLQDETPTDRRAALEYLRIIGKQKDLEALELYGAPGRESFVDEMRRKLAEAGKAQQAGYKTAADQYRAEIDASRKQEIWDKAIGALGKVAAGIVGSHPDWVGAPESVLPVSEHYRYEPLGDKKSEMGAAGTQYKAELGRLGAIPKIVQQQQEAMRKQIDDEKKRLDGREKAILDYLKDKPGLQTKVEQLSKSIREEVTDPLVQYASQAAAQYEVNSQEAARASEVIKLKGASLNNTAHLWKPYLNPSALAKKDYSAAIADFNKAVDLLSKPQKGDVAVIDDPITFSRQAAASMKAAARKKGRSAPTGEEVALMADFLQSWLLGKRMTTPTSENLPEFNKWRKDAKDFGISVPEVTRKVVSAPVAKPGEPPVTTQKQVVAPTP